MLLPGLPRGEWHMLPLRRGIVLIWLFGPPAVQLPRLPSWFLLSAGRGSALSPLEYFGCYHRVRRFCARYSCLHIHPNQAPESRGHQGLDSGSDYFRTYCVATLVVPASGCQPSANTFIVNEPIAAWRTSRFSTLSRLRRDANQEALRACFPTCCGCCFHQAARCFC